MNLNRVVNFSRSLLNGSNTSLPLPPSPSDLSSIILGAFTAVLLAMGLFANGITIKVIWKTKSLHTTTNFLLANLATSDFLTPVFGIPNGLAVILGNHPGGLLGKYLCIFLTAGTPVGMTSMASILTLCYLAVERYHAIVKPMAHHRRLSKENVKFAIGFIWLVPFVICLPLFIHTTFDEKTKFCGDNWEHHNEILFILIAIFLVFVIPSSIIVFCYVAVIKEMYLSKKVDPGPAVQDDDSQAKRKIVKILLAVTSLFLLCFGAFSCLWFLFKARMVPVFPYNVAVQCLFVQSCVNPIIYAFQSTNYRKALINDLKCSWRGVEAGGESTD